MDIVLGVSMAPASVQMVLVEGESADGLLVEEDEFDVSGADAPASAPDQVISAILGTREGAADAGIELSSIGVTFTDQLDAAVLRDALAAHRLENVMLVSAFLAAAALGQYVGGAMGYDRTAVLFVEPDTATLAVIETSDGSIAGVYRETIDDPFSEQATAQLTGMIAELEHSQMAPGGVFLVGSGVDIRSIKPVLETATSLDVSAPEEPQTALARGAALASANAPLFASSTAALAYAQEPGTGAIDVHMLPEYSSVPAVLDGAESADGLAYSAIFDEDADSPTILIDAAEALGREVQPRRRPALLLGSGMAVVAISAVVALEIALAIGIRTTVALQPSPNQSLIVPAAPSASPAQAAAPFERINAPAPVAAPRPISPPLAAAAPALAPPAAAPAPAAPVPVVVPPVIVPAPVRVPIPEAEPRAPLLQIPHQSPPQLFPRPQAPEPFPRGGSPIQQPPGQGLLPRPWSPPGSGLPGGGVHSPEPITGTHPEPGSPGGPLAGGPFGGNGPFGGSGPFGGNGPFGGGGGIPGGIPGGGLPGGGHAGGGLPGGGIPGGGLPGGGIPGGGIPGGGGPFGGGPFGGGGLPGGGFGGGHPGGEPGGGFGGGPFGGGGFGGGGGGFGGGHSGGGGGFGGGHSGGGFGGGGHSGGGGHH